MGYKTGVNRGFCIEEVFRSVQIEPFYNSVGHFIE
jgi:hypothetical protein